MIRIPENRQLLMNVKLKSGEMFENKDITDSPFGEHERLVCFWNGDKIRVYPMHDIEYLELVPQKNL